MPARLTLLSLVAYAMTACTPAAPDARIPPPPPGAQASVEEGPQELRLDDVVLQVREAVQDKAHPLDVTTYRLPAETSWPAVSAHYAQRLAGAQDRRLADSLRGAHARAWTRDGHVLAVALIPGPLPGRDPRPLLVVASD